MERESVLFYAADRAFGEFSSLSRSPTGVNGVVWPTFGSAFQTWKSPFAEAVCAQPTPMRTAWMNRQHDLPGRPDWNAVTDNGRRPALGAQCTQYAAVRTLRLSTEEANIVEHTGNDAYWADGGDGTGLNRLGELLLELRGQLRGQA